MVMWLVSMLLILSRFDHDKHEEAADEKTKHSDGDRVGI